MERPGIEVGTSWYMLRPCALITELLLPRTIPSFTIFQLVVVVIIPPPDAERTFPGLPPVGGAGNPSILPVFDHDAAWEALLACSGGG